MRMDEVITLRWNDLLINFVCFREIEKPRRIGVSRCYMKNICTPCNFQTNRIHWQSTIVRIMKKFFRWLIKINVNNNSYLSEWTKFQFNVLYFHQHRRESYFLVKQTNTLYGFANFDLLWLNYFLERSSIFYISN